jgi:hypothetical protein
MLHRVLAAWHPQTVSAPIYRRAGMNKLAATSLEEMRAKVCNGLSYPMTNLLKQGRASL